MPRPTTSLDPRPLPDDVAGPLRAALADAHVSEPFGPRDVRAAARRVVGLVRALRLEPVVFRGPVDVGGAELDHVFVVVDRRVVDVALPLADPSFRDAVRRWVAGDLDTDELCAAADDRSLDDRVLGRFPEEVAYRGAPVWGAAA